MKKYSSALLTVLALIGLVWAAMMSIRVLSHGMPGAPAAPIPAQQSDAGKAALLRIDGYEKILNRIEREPPLTASAFALPLAPSATLPPSMLASSASTTSKPIAAKKSSPDMPTISLVYISSNLKKAVINGRLLGIGDLLPDGGNIVEIAPQQVVVELHGQRKALLVPKPQLLGIVSKPS